MVSRDKGSRNIGTVISLIPQTAREVDIIVPFYGQGERGSERAVTCPKSHRCELWSQNLTRSDAFHSITVCG